MVNRKLSKILWLTVIAIFISVHITAQDPDEDPSVTSEMSGEIVPDDGTVTEEPVQPSVEEEPVETEPEVSEPEPVDEERPEPPAPRQRRVSTPSRRLRLLEAHGPDITDVRIPEYTVEKEKSQILAEIDDPELQKQSDNDSPDAADTDLVDNDGSKEASDKESSLANAIQNMDYSIRNLIAWGSLGSLLILMIVLYRLRTGRKRRRVFRKIPSKRR